MLMKHWYDGKIYHLRKLHGVDVTHHYNVGPVGQQNHPSGEQGLGRASLYCQTGRGKIGKTAYQGVGNRGSNHVHNIV